MNELMEKCEKLVKAWHEAGRADFERKYLHCDYDQDNQKVVNERRKYIALDVYTGVQTFGTFLVDKETGNIYRIKSKYGVPNFKKCLGHIDKVSGERLFNLMWW